MPSAAEGLVGGVDDTCVEVDGVEGLDDCEVEGAGEGGEMVTEALEERREFSALSCLVRATASFMPELSSIRSGALALVLHSGSCASSCCCPTPNPCWNVSCVLVERDQRELVP